MAPARNHFFRDGASGEPNPDLLVECGPVLNVLIHVPAALADTIARGGGTLPAPEAGVALIDTGATLTCVHEPVLQKLGLNPIGTLNSATAAGPGTCNTYPARLEFPADGIDSEFNSVVGVDLSGQYVKLSSGTHPIIALIGRDVLRNWILIYNGTGGVVSIAY